MPTYTVKAGDTKTKLKQQFGVNVDDSQFRSNDPNKLFAGEVINYGGGTPNGGATQKRVDLSQIKEGVQNFSEPTQNLRDVSVAFSGKADDNAMQDIANRNPELVDRAFGARAGAAAGEFSPVDFNFEDLAPEEQLRRNSAVVQEEIATIEERMASSETRRNAGYEEGDVFEDMRQLNVLKDELRKAEDRDIEIPVEARQKLRGNQATKTEFGQETRPELENNLLRSLAASRNVSRLSETIRTNMSIVDSEINAQTKEDEFILGKKVERLNKLTSVYGDIMTEKQKVDAAAKQFEYDVALESLSSDNSLRADLIKDAVKRGVTEPGMMNMSIDDLLQLKSETTSSARWDDMTFEEAAMTLDKDSFEKFEAYREWGKTATAEEKAASDQTLTVAQNTKDIVNVIEAMLNDEQGIKVSVGESGLGRTDARLFSLGAEGSTFRKNAKQLTAKKTIEQLLQIKAAGATLGAISEKELQLLADAATALGALTDDKGNSTGKFELDEEVFKTELETMRMGAMKVYIATHIGSEAYNKAGYINADFETVQTRYVDLIENSGRDFASEEINTPLPGSGPVKTSNPFFLNPTLELIREEEGLRTEAYQDVTGKWTIGYGNTIIDGRPVGPNDKLTVPQAETLMRESVVTNYTTFTDRVEKDITPNQFAALTSFEYNLGPGVWQQPTGQRILKLIDDGEYRTAGQLMQQYNKARNPQTGELETNRGLANRRAREASLLLT
tara:strand:- start:399 stop:2588 length:2190 start_codon:yes stop_codon:yes gene_type:complete